MITKSHLIWLWLSGSLVLSCAVDGSDADPLATARFLSNKMMANVTFQHQPLSEAVAVINYDFKESGTARVPSVVINLKDCSEEEVRAVLNRIVTLNIRNVAAYDVLGYIAEEANCSLTIKNDTIWLTPYRNRN